MIHKIKALFIVILLFAFFHCVDICNKGTETRLNKTAGTLAQIKAEAPMHTNKLLVTLVAIHLYFFLKSVSLNNVLDKITELLNFIKSLFFNSLCDERKSTHKALLLL